MRFLITLALLCVSLFADDKLLQLCLKDSDLEVCKKVFNTHDMQCKNDILKSCIYMAWLYANGNFVEKDLNKALDLTKKACDGNLMAGCRIAGLFYLQDNNTKDAYISIAKSCKGNDALACELLADFYLSGTAVKKDERKSYLLAKKACEMDNICFLYAKFYTDGISIKRDWDRAFMLFKKSCDKQNYSDSCSVVAGAYYDGIIVRRDYKLTLNYAQKACDGGNSYSCFLLGILYHNGLGVRADTQKAKEYSGKSCDLGYQQSCDFYKTLPTP